MTFTSFFFFFNAPATTEISTLSLHDALPISPAEIGAIQQIQPSFLTPGEEQVTVGHRDYAAGAEIRIVHLEVVAILGILRSEEHSLNSSHGYISYAVFCLKKKKKTKYQNGEQ